MSYFSPRPILVNLLVRLLRALRRGSPVLALLAMVLLTRPAAAQSGVGIGTIAPDAKAALDIVSTDKGLLVPRMSATQRGNILTPPAGLLVYQLDGAQPGFWYYEATAGWTHLNPTGADNLGNHTATQSLQLNNNWLSNDGTATGLRLDNTGSLGVGGVPYPGFRLSAELPGYRTMLLRDSRAAGHQVGPHQFFVVGPTGASEYAGAIVDYIHADTVLPHRTNALEVRAAGQGGNGRINFYTGMATNLSKPQVTIRANGTVGIGLAATADPYRPLHVEGGIHASGPIGELSFADRTVPTARFVWYSQNEVARLFVSDLNSAGTNLLGVTRAGGRLGLGTLSPQKKFHLYTTTQYGGMRIHVAPGVNTFGSGSLEFWSDPQGNANEWRPGMIRSTDLGGFTGGLAFYVNGTGSTHKTDSIEVMRITNRRVGIGTINPGTALHVVDTASNKQTIGYFEGYDPGYAGVYVNTVKATARPFWGYRRQGAIVGWHEIATNGDWNMVLKNNVGGFMVPLTVTDTLGWLGLGTSVPHTRFAITPFATEPKITLWDGGSTTSHYGFGISSFQLNYHVNAATDNHVFFAGGKNGDGTELLRIKGTGLVGIGVTNPLTRLSVSPNVLEPKITLWDGGGATNHFGFGISLNQLNYHVAQPADAHVFYAGGKNANGTELLRIKGNGYVGIGTSNPQQQLHIYSPTHNAKLRLQGANPVGGTYGAAGIEFWSDQQGTSGEWRPGMIRSTDQATGTYTGGLAFYVNGTSFANRRDTVEVMRLTNRRVGIGTPAPGFHFHLQDTTGAQTVAQLEGSDATFSGMYINATKATGAAFYGYRRQGLNVGYHYVSNGGDWRLNLNNVDRFVATDDGRLGVNVTNPGYPLHVIAPSNAFSTVAQFDGSQSGFAGVYANATTVGAAPFYGYQQQGAIKAYHYVNSTGDWQLFLNGGVRLTVDATTGGLGIGTVNPIAKLHINGGVSATPTGATYSFFSPGSASLSTSTTATSRAVAAYIEGGQFWVNSAIVAGALNTSSDQRIKRVLGTSNGAADLGLLNQLRITDYRYIDQVNNTGEVVKKVIAQEVERVLPAAVTRSRMAIPDVYEVAAGMMSAQGTTTVRTTKAHGFKTGDQVRLYTPQNQDLNPTVTVLDAHTFTLTTPAEVPARLFVYGKFVDDFRSVDYDALSMLNVSATQELARKLAALEQQNEQLRQQAGHAQQQAAAAEAATQRFEQRLREVEARLGTATR